MSGKKETKEAVGRFRADSIDGNGEILFSTGNLEIWSRGTSRRFFTECKTHELYKAMQEYYGDCEEFPSNEIGTVLESDTAEHALDAAAGCLLNAVASPGDLCPICRTMLRWADDMRENYAWCPVDGCDYTYSGKSIH